MLGDDRPIGVFDSGIGGLTVVRLFRRDLAGEDLLYLGDTVHVPYGNKSGTELIMYARQVIDFLVDKGAKIIVAACNTSSSVSLPFIEDDYSIPILGIIKPGARAAVKATRNGRVGVLATEATVLSSAYKREIQSLASNCLVWERACPRLVPLIEAGFVDDAETVAALREYLTPLKENNVDTVVLGCTHYPYLVPLLKRLLPESIAIVDPAEEMVSELKGFLQQEQALNKSGCGEVRFYATGSDESFFRVGQFFLGQTIDRVERVKLD